MRRWGSEDGLALIVVLWTIVILSFLLLSLSEDIQLESFLTRNLMEQIQVQFIAQAGISRGIAELTGDRTISDGIQEKWLTPVQGQIDNRGSFVVQIEDIGSRFNINYIGEPVLSALVQDLGKEFSEWRLDKLPFYLKQELEEFESVDFSQIENLIAYNGKFNINTDDYAVLKQIVLAERISEWTAEQVIHELAGVEKPVTSLDDLLLKVPGLDLNTFEVIRDEIDVKGNINLNMVSEEVLVVLCRALGIPQDQVTAITTMREKETIESLDVLNILVGDENYKKIIPYFDITSKYFRITSTAQSASTAIEKKIIIELERIPERVAQGRVLEWRTKILSWVES